LSPLPRGTAGPFFFPEVSGQAGRQGVHYSHSTFKIQHFFSRSALRSPRSAHSCIHAIMQSCIFYLVLDSCFLILFFSVSPFLRFFISFLFVVGGLPSAVSGHLAFHCICTIPENPINAMAMRPVIMSAIPGPRRAGGILFSFSRSRIPAMARIASSQPIPLPAPKNTL
jgi:hypothetical protein